MVGDGANDLIALKEANIGIGLSSSDAIYGATFSVPSLSHVIEVII
jgi:P-type E1-E2 ATPase